MLCITTNQNLIDFAKHIKFDASTVDCTNKRKLKKGITNVYETIKCCEEVDNDPSTEKEKKQELAGFLQFLDLFSVRSLGGNPFMHGLGYAAKTSLRRNELEIRGQIEAGQKDKISYVSLVHQISEAKSSGYDEEDIVKSVIKAMVYTSS